MLKALAVALLLSLPACYPVHSVKAWSADDPRGIPFYAPQGKRKQTTSYTVTWLEVSLVPTGGGATKLFLIRESQWDRAKALALLTEDDAPTKFEAAFRAALLAPAEIQHGLSTPRRQLDDGRPLLVALVGNSIEPLVEVDYGTRYAYNVHAPLIGTGNSLVELGGDGTLKKADAKVDSSKLADVLPIEEVLKAAFGISSDAERMAPGTTTKYQLDVQQKGYLFAFTKKHPWTAEVEPPLPFDTEANPFTRTALDASAKPKPKPENAIEFSGTIVPPKESK
jgi:hypothetical protein